MDSPGSSLPLYGSSRTTGGTTYGCAVGNVFNLADASDDDEETLVLRTSVAKVQSRTEVRT